MSGQAREQDGQQEQKQEPYRVVMRMAGMRPEQMAGYEMHRRRGGGDMSHIDPSRSHLNRRLIGPADWAQRAWEEIAEMRAENHALDLEMLRKHRRTAELRQRLLKGPRDPWSATKHGPMRELVLTANKKWFAEEDGDPRDASYVNRERRFEDRAVGWLRETFGQDCIHARADLDEEAYHIHAVILPRTVTKTGRRKLRPSVHEVIRSYEFGQDHVGKWFGEIGLERGERRKQAYRKARDHNRAIDEAEARGETPTAERVEIPEKRYHVSPRLWREEQERKLAARDLELKDRTEALDVREGACAARETDCARQAERNATQKTALEAYEETLLGRSAALDGREREAARRGAEATKREHEAAKRETDAAARAAEADQVLDAARRLAAGDLNALAGHDAPDGAGDGAGADAGADADGRTGFSAGAAASGRRADGSVGDPAPRVHPGLRLFARALGVLRERAWAEARAEARAELRREYDEVRAVDEVIVEIAGSLGAAARARIVQIRSRLARPLVALKRTILRTPEDGSSTSQVPVRRGPPRGRPDDPRA